MLSVSNWVLILGCVLVHSMHKTYQVHALENGPLYVHNGDTLHINTSSLIATHTNASGDTVQSRVMTSRSGTPSISGQDQNFTYHVAELQYQGTITFDHGSKVLIEGNRSLSIESKNGNITINTDLILTNCTTGLNETCIGGYTVQTPSVLGGIYKGDGPGWKNYSSQVLGNLVLRCIPGAAHGGIGGITNNYDGILKGYTDFAAKYGKDDFQSLLGGSAGFMNGGTDGFFYGGGAIELIAKNGTIHIDALISATAMNGFAESLGKPFTGSSGGLIRLRAKEVVMTTRSSLNVNGGNASIGRVNHGNGESGNGGGSGGVIQIDAPKGIVYNLSLSGGQSYCKGNYYTPAENGFLIIKGYNQTIERNQSWIELYKWPNNSQPSTNATNSKDDLLGLSKELTLIKAKLREGISAEEFRNSVLSHFHRLMNFSTSKNFTEKELLVFVQIFENYTEIIDKILSLNLPLDVKDIYRSFLKLSSVVMATNNQQNWKKLEKLPYFVSLLESMATSISVNSTLDYQSETIVVQSNQFKHDNMEGYKFPVRSKLRLDSFITLQDFIYIPKASLSQTPDEYKFITLFFKNIQEALPKSSRQIKESTELLKVSSLLMLCSLLYNGSLVTKLASPAFLHFDLKKREGTEVKAAQCSFWNTKNNSWDEEGMSVKELQPSKSICTTTHFTSFAVLMQHTPIKMTEAQELALVLITYIGCGISTGTLLIALIVFLSIEGLTSDRHRIHLNLVIALLLAQIIFLTGIKATDHEILCKVIAGTLHYFFMASFTWMLIEGVHLYLKVVKVFGIENIKVQHYYILGWGIPALIVGAAAIYKPHGYGTKYVCWLSLDDGFVWAFIGPALAIIAVNCVILIVVVKTVVSSASTMKSSEHSHIKAGLKGALVLMPLMGITWLFGLLAVNKESLVFQYVFSIANSLQGLLIFLFHIVFNKEVRSAFRRQRERRQLSKESADYNASVTCSNESERKTWAKGESTSNSTVKTGLSGIKARLSMSMMTRSSRVVSVQPIKSIDDEVQVNRKYHHKSPSSGLSAAMHCPKMYRRSIHPPLYNDEHNMV